MQVLRDIEHKWPNAVICQDRWVKKQWDCYVTNGEQIGSRFYCFGQGIDRDLDKALSKAYVACIQMEIRRVKEIAQEDEEAKKLKGKKKKK